MLTPLIKKVLLFFGGFWLLCFVLSRLGAYWVTKDVPPFLVDMQDHLVENPKMEARLGEHASFEYTYNAHDVVKDTLPYTSTLRGDKGSLQIQGKAVKQQGRWVPVKSDTLFTPAE